MDAIKAYIMLLNYYYIYSEYILSLLVVITYINPLWAVNLFVKLQLKNSVSDSTNLFE